MRMMMRVYIPVEAGNAAILQTGLSKERRFMRS